jgi:hypothetical protein
MFEPDLSQFLLLPLPAIWAVFFSPSEASSVLTTFRVVVVRSGIYCESAGRRQRI